MRRHPDRLILMLVVITATAGAVWLVAGLGIH